MRQNFRKRSVPRKIEWTEKLSTEVISLDHQHAELINLFNDFVEAVEAERPREDTCQLFETLLTHTKKHFDYEEQIMQNIGFKDFRAHKSYHDTLLKDALLVLDDLRNNAAPEDIAASVNFLRALVVKHMVEQDLKIGEFITGGATD